MRYFNKITEQTYKAVGRYQAVDGTVMTVLERDDGAKLSVSEDRLNRLYLKMPETRSVTFGMSVSEDGTVTKFITIPTNS
jgi:hypothetical protein